MSLSFSGSCIHDTNLNNSLPVIQKILGGWRQVPKRDEKQPRAGVPIPHLESCFSRDAQPCSQLPRPSHGDRRGLLGEQGCWRQTVAALEFQCRLQMD